MLHPALPATLITTVPYFFSYFSAYSIPGRHSSHAQYGQRFNKKISEVSKTDVRTLKYPTPSPLFHGQSLCMLSSGYFGT